MPELTQIGKAEDIRELQWVTLEKLLLIKFMACFKGCPAVGLRRLYLNDDDEHKKDITSRNDTTATDGLMTSIDYITFSDALKIQPL